MGNWILRKKEGVFCFLAVFSTMSILSINYLCSQEVKQENKLEDDKKSEKKIT